MTPETLQLLLTIIATAAKTAEGFTPAGAGQTAEEATAALVLIVQAALAAHQQVAGRPIDLNTLQPLPPLT